MAGPIEFVSDEPVDDKGPTEYGGVAGLIQPEFVDGLAGHTMTASEGRGVVVRAREVLVPDPLTGLYAVDESADAVDPVTGLKAGAGVHEDGTTVKPVDAPPRTGEPRSGIL